MIKLKWPAIAMGALLAISAARGADAGLARYAAVDVGQVKTWAYLANITLTAERFVRRGDTFTAAYSADVFPFFFYSEKGALHITVPDDSLRRLARGEGFDFTGSAVRADGKARAVDGRATPIDATSGRLKVRIYYSRHMVIVFNATYCLPAVATGAGRGRSG